MIIVGAGNLGQALANYQSFNEDYGYKVMALFDVNPKLIGISVRGVKVLDTDELENFIKTHGITSDCQEDGRMGNQRILEFCTDRSSSAG